MSFSTKEYKEKIERLVDLEEENFNIPRFFYLEKLSNNEKIENLINWAENISKFKNLFNIRTYDYHKSSEKEINLSPHICDLSFNNLKDKIYNFNKEFYCMVDAESPDDGRMAGNILIETDSKNSKNIFIEYVIKENRAMVRDINTDSNVKKIFFPNFRIDKVNKVNKEKTETEIKVLNSVIDSANKFWKKNIILEWTYFKNPSGIKFAENIFPDSYIVWWEYRSIPQMTLFI